MKILVFGNGSLSLCQQERYISHALAKAGHEVHLLCNPPTSLVNVDLLPSHPNLICETLPMQEYRFDQWYTGQKFDCVFGMDQSVSPIVAEYKNRAKTKAFCMFLDFPVHVIDGQDKFNYNFGYSQRFYYWVQCALELDGVVFNNNVAVEEFYKRYKREAHLVWYPVISNYTYDDFSADGPSKDYIIGCHRLIPYKGTDYLIKAIMRSKYTYKQIFVSGDKDHMAALNGLAKDAIDRGSELEFKQAASEKDKMSLLYNARLVVYPQITEWIGGMSILEGMSVQTPGVCFDYPVLKELYGDCALYAVPKSIGDLREKISQLYNDQDLLGELSKKGHERFQKYFTVDVMADNLTKVFEV